MAGYRYRDTAAKSETLRLKTSKALGVNVPLDNTRSIEMRPVSGKVTPTVAEAAIQLLDALAESNSLDTTDLTSLLVITTRGTSTESAIGVITVGMPLTTRSMTGMKQELSRIVHAYRQMLRDRRRSSTS